MFKPSILSIIPLLVLATSISAACNNHSYTTCDDKIVHWYDPDTGEICDPFDCGGGRAPQRKDVPGCPRYTGTKTRETSASYLSCWTPSASADSTATAVSASNKADSAPTNTSTETGSDTATAPSTTPPPTLSTTSTLSASGSGPETESPTNAGNLLDSSLMVGVGAAIGALALI